ncbi:MAG: hypothetical protein J3Q66DRAFT_443302 [Benniella sp.]|nr:MAG: hypothetical protein J3Q66DRAFT_443302 [Benniella sp.]
MTDTMNTSCHSDRLGCEERLRAINPNLNMVVSVSPVQQSELELRKDKKNGDLTNLLSDEHLQFIYARLFVRHWVRHVDRVQCYANYAVFSYRTIEYCNPAYPRNGHELQSVMGRINIPQVPRVPLKSASEVHLDPLREVKTWNLAIDAAKPATTSLSMTASKRKLKIRKAVLRILIEAPNIHQDIDVGRVIAPHVSPAALHGLYLGATGLYETFSRSELTDIHSQHGKTFRAMNGRCSEASRNTSWSQKSLDLQACDQIREKRAVREIVKVVESEEEILRDLKRTEYRWNQLTRVTKTQLKAISSQAKPKLTTPVWDKLPTEESVKFPDIARLLGQQGDNQMLIFSGTDYGLGDIMDIIKIPPSFAITAKKLHDITFTKKLLKTRQALLASGELYKGGDFNKPGNKRLNIKDLLPKKFKFRDKDQHSVLHVSPLPKNLQDHLKPSKKGKRTKQEDLEQLLSYENLQLLYSRFISATRGGKPETEGKHLMWAKTTDA